MDRLLEIESDSSGNVLQKEIYIGANRDVIAAIIFLFVSAAYGIEVTELSVPFEGGNAGPAFYPAMLTGVMLICSVYLLLKGLKKEEGTQIEIGRFIQPTAYVVLTMIYVEAFMVLGYLASTLFYTLGVALVFELGRRPLLKSVGISTLIAVLSTVIGLVFFEFVFNVRLPEGIFGGML